MLADVSPPELLRIAELPRRYAAALRRYRYGPGAFKLDWALDGPIPWTAARMRGAPRPCTSAGRSTSSRPPSGRRGQAGRRSARSSCSRSTALLDETRAPAGKHTAWAYCHVPNGWEGDATEAIEAQIERFAPGFRDLILARSAMGPARAARRTTATSSAATSTAAR